jgi:hypothetical protein
MGIKLRTPAIAANAIFLLFFKKSLSLCTFLLMMTSAMLEQTPAAEATKKNSNRLTLVTNASKTGVEDPENNDTIKKMCAMVFISMYYHS